MLRQGQAEWRGGGGKEGWEESGAESRRPYPLSAAN